MPAITLGDVLSSASPIPRTTRGKRDRSGVLFSSTFATENNTTYFHIDLGIITVTLRNESTEKSYFEPI